MCWSPGWKGIRNYFKFKVVWDVIKNQAQKHVLPSLIHAARHLFRCKMWWKLDDIKLEAFIRSRLNSSIGQWENKSYHIATQIKHNRVVKNHDTTMRETVRQARWSRGHLLRATLAILLSDRRSIKDRVIIVVVIVMHSVSVHVAVFVAEVIHRNTGVLIRVDGGSGQKAIVDSRKTQREADLARCYIMWSIAKHIGSHG